MLSKLGILWHPKNFLNFFDMSNLELIFNMLGEASTTEIAKTHDTQGFKENKLAAKKGGKIAGDARKNLELETGGKVVNEKNYLHLAKKKKLM